MCTYFGMTKCQVLAKNLINKYSNHFCSDIISQDCINFRLCIMLNKNWYNDYKMLVGKNEVESVHGYLKLLPLKIS